MLINGYGRATRANRTSYCATVVLPDGDARLSNGTKKQMNATFEKVKALMVGEFKIDPQAITPETQLTELGVDSLTALEFVFVLEEAFGLTMDNDRDLRGGLVEDVVNAVERALSQRPAMPVPLNRL